MRILHLTLKKAPFEVMYTREKPYEIRVKSKWINSRLFNKDGSKKHYDLVRYTNGYGKDKPYFIAEYKGFDNCNGINWTFSNGFHIEFNDDRWIIYFGEIIERGNLDEPKSDNPERGR